MGVRNLFQRKAATTAPAAAAQGAAVAQDDLSPEVLEDLRCAWDELAEAAKASKVINFHACTRTGRSCTEDPAAVRSIAATLREFPDTDRLTGSPRRALPGIDHPKKAPADPAGGRLLERAKHGRSTSVHPSTRHEIKSES